MYDNSIRFGACHVLTEISKNEKLKASVKSAKIVICVGFLYNLSFVDVFCMIWRLRQDNFHGNITDAFTTTISTSPAQQVVA